jgi:hypothetical protein
MKNTSKDYDGHPEPGRSIQKKELNQIQYSILLSNAQGKVKFIEGNFQRVQDELNGRRTYAHRQNEDKR